MIANLLTTYVMMVFAVLVIPLILAVFIPPVGGPLVQGVLWLFFVAPFRLVASVVRSLG